jgi:hypothetical protein
MFVPFNSIHDRSRVWIFQANRKINSSERKIISDTLRAFTESWLVHGSQMQASYDIRFDQFILLAADEQANAASGCSIDDSVRTIKNLGVQLNLDFFDRTQIAFKKQDDVIIIPMAELKVKFDEGAWDSTSLVFNNLVATKSDLETKWLAPANSTWLKRYLSKQETAFK